MALPPPWIYVATAEAFDDEMAARIAAHRARRGADGARSRRRSILPGRLPLAGEAGAGRLPDAVAHQPHAGRARHRRRDRSASKRRWPRAQAPVVLVSNEVGSGIVPDNALARRFRDLQGRLNQRIAARADRVVLHGRRPAAGGEGTAMSNDRRSTAEAERHRAKMAKRKAVQDAEVADKTIEKGLLIVHTGTGKGKSTAAFGLALRMLGRGRRVGVVQFIKGAWQTGERDALERFGDQVVWHTMGEGFTWETQDRARDIAAAERAWAKARELMADPTIGAARPRRAQHRAALRLSRSRRGGRRARGAPARPARRRHRPQRQAGADRGRRPRHRDDAGQAPLRRRREGAAGHRVLMPCRRARSCSRAPARTSASRCSSPGLARAFTATRPARCGRSSRRTCRTMPP